MSHYNPSLRDRCVDAMMRDVRDAGFLTDPTASELALDALLNCLAENGDEWMNAATQESILDAPSNKDDVDYLLAVLREKT